MKSRRRLSQIRRIWKRLWVALDDGDNETAIALLDRLDELLKAEAA